MRLPPGHRVDAATSRELHAAGFHGGPDAYTERRAGTPLLDEYAMPDATVEVPIDSLTGLGVVVLRDAVGAIVATWDEGRWWTVAESDAYVAALRRLGPDRWDEALAQQPAPSITSGR